MQRGDGSDARGGNSGAEPTFRHTSNPRRTHPNHRGTRETEIEKELTAARLRVEQARTDHAEAQRPQDPNRAQRGRPRGGHLQRASVAGPSRGRLIHGCTVVA